MLRLQRNHGCATPNNAAQPINISCVEPPIRRESCTKLSANSHFQPGERRVKIPRMAKKDAPQVVAAADRPVNGTWTFLRTFLSKPDVVGAAIPSSRYLARSLITPYLDHKGPVTILEAGAGTGTVTARIGQSLKPDDRLDICEMEPDFVRFLDTQVLTQPQFADAKRTGRLRLLGCPVQDIEGENKYDYIIGGLPFTAFNPSAIREIFTVLHRLLKPGGVFSYFEYRVLRRLRKHATLGHARLRAAEVGEILDDQIQRFQFDRRSVWLNIPPCSARYLRFHATKHNGSKASKQTQR